MPDTIPSAETVRDELIKAYPSKVGKKRAKHILVNDPANPPEIEANVRTIPGIITHGGTAVNVVPEYAAARFSVRATESDFSFEVVEKVVACAEASAAAMGATVKISHERHYANRIPNLVMARLFAENIGSLGENVQTPDANERRGSSDMGNVSQILPAIHPYVTIAAPGTGGHTPEFAVAAASPWGHQALIRSAKALAMTAVDLFTQPELLAEAKSEFARTVNPDPAWRKKKFFA